jgi:hypothetical protein
MATALLWLLGQTALFLLLPKRIYPYSSALPAMGQGFFTLYLINKKAAYRKSVPLKNFV